MVRLTNLIFLIIGSLLLLSALAVHAYVPQGPQVLELLVGKIGQARSLLVHQHLLLPESKTGGAAVEVKEVLRYLFPKSFRSDIQEKEMQRIHVVSGEQSLTVVNGRIEAQAPGRIDSYKDVLLNRSRLDLHKALAKLGINVGVCSLGRFEEKIGFVIGAKYPDEGVSQLWVDQETLLPMRLLLIAAARSAEGQSEPDRLDIHYGDWRKFGKIFYPMQITFSHNGIHLREIRADDVQVNPVLNEDMMDIHRLTALYPPAQEPQKVPAETETEDDIQKTINDFKQKFEESEPR